MPRFECDADFELLSQHREKRAGDPRVEFQAWRQLYEQASEARPQRGEVREECLDQLCAVSEPLIMSNLARKLYGKPERARNARGPSFKRRGAVWAIERGIDFDGGQHLRITREMRLARGKMGLLRARNAPTGGADIDLRGHTAILGTAGTLSVGLGPERHLPQPHAAGSEHRIRDRGADDTDASFADIGVSLMAG